MNDAVHADRLMGLSPEARSLALAELSEAECTALLYDWRFWARANQLPPPGPWFCWLVLAGRGFGKTRMGAEWVRELAQSGAVDRIALVGDTMDDVRNVMVEGESGLLACEPPGNRPSFEPSNRRLTWANGCVANLYSAADPEQLRGPQHGAAWADEIAKWPKGESAWQNLLMGLRLGRQPRVLATTTPRPVPWLKALMSRPSTVVSRGATMDNKAHLAAPFLAEMQQTYAGTRIGRQELDGEILEEQEGALWTRDMLDACRVNEPPSGVLERLVVAVDPPVSVSDQADACGIIAAGRAVNGHIYVLDDATVQGVGPSEWMAKALALYEQYQADRLVAEVNNGGVLVETLARQLKPDVSFRAVRATRGKLVRAEPVAALYEQGRVHHCAALPMLEDELCGYDGHGDSPDRMDALVWAVTDLAITGTAEPRLRRI